MPKSERSTESGMVAARVPSARNTDTVWVYIMFCADTSPAPDATTDLGLRPPVMRLTCSSAVRSAGTGGRVVVVVVSAAVVVGVSLTLFAWRAPTVTLGGSMGLISRESFLLVNSVLLVVATGAVLLGTIYPLIIDALNYNKAIRQELPLAPVDLGRLLREMLAS